MRGPGYILGCYIWPRLYNLGCYIWPRLYIRTKAKLNQQMVVTSELGFPYSPVYVMDAV